MDENALKCLVEKAQSGDADAQYELALMILDERSQEQSTADVDKSNLQQLREGSRWLTLAAINGQIQAQTDLAKRYHFGIDMPRNQSKALLWFRQAAEGGAPEAQYFLGEIYTADDLVSYDIKTAIEWYERSARQGFHWAQLALFDIYRNGADLILPDVDRALYWGRKAGEQGNLQAQMNLGRMFFEGDVVERNTMESAFWLHLAADLDDEAKYYLALLYFHGQGVEKNVNRAADLLRGSAAKGDCDAMVQLAIVLSEMPWPPHDEIRSWLARASELGHIHAREMLNEIESTDKCDEDTRIELEKMYLAPNVDSIFSEGTIAQMMQNLSDRYREEKQLDTQKESSTTDGASTTTDSDGSSGSESDCAA